MPTEPNPIVKFPPAIKPTVIKSSGKFKKYGVWWSPYTDPLKMELEMIRHGGKWTKSDGEEAGEGLFSHYRKFQEIAWPLKIWERGPFKNHWAEKCLEVYLNHTYIGAMGSAGSGKSDSFGGNVLTDWYAHSEYTTVLVSSTDLKSLELRIWGMIKKYHRAAKEGHPWLPGYLIEGKQMLTLDPRDDASDGRDFKNGIIAVACKKGSQFVGLGPLIGIHNKRVRLLADECFIPGTLVDTATGPRPIETIREGDCVRNATGFTVVRCVSKRASKSLYRITLQDGRTIVCTKRHPFLTRNGWVRAIDLGVMHYLFSQDESIRWLQDPYDNSVKKVLLRDMTTPMPRPRKSEVGRMLNPPKGCRVKSVELVSHTELNSYPRCGHGIWVYNLQVEGHPSYSVNGIIVHNCNLMPRAFLDAAANLSKCEDFKLVGLGNPNETTNAHGFLCEPSVELGGWEGGVDQSPGTKTWPTRFPNGICLQLPGSDSPNMRAPEGDPPPFPFLITRQQMEDDAQIWGVDDWHYTMMNEARMPRGQGSRRVLTRQSCVKFGAFGEPNWKDSNRTRIAFLDAAYRGVGGDRCVFGELQFGFEVSPLREDLLVSNLVSQSNGDMRGKHIVALIDLINIPINSSLEAESPEDQIVKFVRDQCTQRSIPAENFFFDAGMRTSLVTAFSRLWDVNVNSIDCGGKPTEKPVSSEIQTLCRDYYSKFVTELWFSVRYAVEAGQFRGMTEEAVTEFSQREWKMVSGNRIEIEAKDEMKTKTGRSPDLADAVAIGLFGARQRGFIITKLSTLAPPIKRGPDWRTELTKKARQIRSAGHLDFSA